jgi:prepilin-type N-terminal cleavage/methylation domain-containing protein
MALFAMKKLRLRGRSTPVGFTLIELLVVIGLMALMLAFAIPAFQGASRGGAMRTAIFQLNTTMSLARQTAISTRQSVSILFPDDSLSYTTNSIALAFSAYAAYSARDGYMRDWTRLPNGVVFHADWAFPGESGPDIRNIFLQTTNNFEVNVSFPLPDDGRQDVLAFTFRPDGALDKAGFRPKGVYLTEGFVNPGSTDLVYIPETSVFGLEIRPESGQARVREYNP